MPKRTKKNNGTNTEPLLPNNSAYQSRPSHDPIVTQDPITQSEIESKRQLRYTRTLKGDGMQLFVSKQLPLAALYNKEKQTNPLAKGIPIQTRQEEIVFNGSGTIVGLSINTNWEENTKEIQQLTSQWRQIQQDKLLEKLLKLIETLLEQPKQTFRFLDALEKFSVQPPNSSSRFINFFNLIEEIRLATQHCQLETKTKAWFAMKLDGSSLNEDLSSAELRYFPERMSNLIEKFLSTLVNEEQLNNEALTAKFEEIFPQSSSNNNNDLHHIHKIVLDAAKEVFLQQVKEDLIAIRNNMDRTLDFSIFKNVKYLTIGASSKKPSNIDASSQKLQNDKFADLVCMLKAMEFSNLEGIVIEDLSVFQNKSKLAQLFLFIEKNKQTLQKITILNGGTSEDVANFRTMLEAFANITLNVEGSPTPSPQPEKKSFKFFKRSQSRQDERDTYSVGSRCSPSSS
ncbi:hypothetical protein [Legionella sp. WA2022007384]